MIVKTVSEARAELSDLLGKVQHGAEQVTILRNGKPVAVIVSIEDYEFMESAEDALWVKRIAETEAEPGHDRNDTVPHDEVWAKIARDTDAA
jgi:prevent-host-death family protein